MGQEHKLSRMDQSRGRAMMLGKLMVVGLIPALMSCATGISGKLISENGDPIAVADGRVNISKLGGTNESRATEAVRIAKDGSFASTGDLSEGSYLVEALVPGYSPASATVELSKAQDLVLKLRPIAPVQTKTIGTGEGVEFSRGSGAADLMPPNF